MTGPQPPDERWPNPTAEELAAIAFIPTGDDEADRVAFAAGVVRAQKILNGEVDTSNAMPLYDLSKPAKLVYPVYRPSRGRRS